MLSKPEILWLTKGRIGLKSAKYHAEILRGSVFTWI